MRFRFANRMQRLRTSDIREILTLRLNFSNMPEERIAEGIARLGGALLALLAEEAEHEPVPAA